VFLITRVSYKKWSFITFDSKWNKKIDELETKKRRRTTTTKMFLDKKISNKDKSAARFCRQVASCIWDMFCNFYLMKSHKIANNSTTTDARKNIERRLLIL
jgi:hypothetical protein